MKVLIVKTSSMGDLIHTLPALSDARKARPEIRFDWVCERAFAEIPAWHPAVDNVIPINLRGWKRKAFSKASLEEAGAALRLLRSVRYDSVIDAQGLIKSAIVTLLARGTGIGMTRSSCKEGLASLGYRKRFEIRRGRHAIDRVRELFSKALNYDFDPSRLDYGLEPKDFLPERDEKPYLVFLHGSSAARKLWSIDEWIALSRLVESEGFNAVAPWGDAEEHARAESLASVCGNLRVLPRMSLSDLAGVIAGASGVVGVDTGLAHLAAALGIPATTLYIATSPELTGARGANQLCLTARDLPKGCASNRDSAGSMQSRTVENLDAVSVWAALREQMSLAL